jgi:glycosyltransferase involved in cell wall biosynthesis
MAPSATGLPVVGFGAPLAGPPPSCVEASLVSRARSLLAETGGDLSSASDLPFAALLFDDAMARLAAAIPARGAATDLLAHALARRARIVRLSALDAPYAEELRVAEIVTSLQIGGAEKIACDLARHLPRALVSARLIGLGGATRTRWESVEGELDLGGSRLGAAARVALLVKELLGWGADVAHAHLFGPDVLGALADAGYPPLVTIHNAAAGFPEGTSSLTSDRVSLVVACAEAVERDLVSAGVAAPVRTVRNGVSPQARASGQNTSELRRSWGFAPETIALLVVANPRPQKRLERIAPILLALARRTGRPVAVVWAGAPSWSDERAVELARRFVAGLEEASIRCVSLGADPELGPVYAACDALLSVSDYEGLSLAHLEAVAAGLAVVSTDVGGTAEIAMSRPPTPFRLVPANASAECVAAALEAALPSSEVGKSPPVESPLPERFSTRAMVRGYARLARRAASRLVDGAAAEVDLVLVTNNFSPGGAQSSARRLLVELARRGRRVLAVTLEETDERPTPGLVALRADGVPVLALPRVPAAEAVSTLVDVVDRRGARALVFWNAIVEYKVLLADLLYDVPLFDVSPGEMYFSSLSRYFERPRADVPYESPRAYGLRLRGAIVKFEAERALAMQTLGTEVHVVPNGVPLRARPARAEGGPIRFGTSVRIHPHKRLDRLIEAFARMHHGGVEAELLVLGAPDADCDAHLDELRKQACDLPVRWLGFRDDVGTFLDSLDAFVLVAEPAGCPNASLEALGAGLPTIATDVGGIGEQLGEGAGLLAPRDDVDALAEHMRSVATSAALRRELSAKATARIEKLFSMARMADDYERLFFGGTSVAPS